MPDQGHIHRTPSWVYRYAETEARAEGLRPADIIGQLIKLGVEVREARKAEGDKAKRVIAELRAIAP